jgi:hypothetical protein
MMNMTQMTAIVAVVKTMAEAMPPWAGPNKPARSRQWVDGIIVFDLPHRGP